MIVRTSFRASLTYSGSRMYLFRDICLYLLANITLFWRAYVIATHKQDERQADDDILSLLDAANSHVTDTVQSQYYSNKST